MPVQINEVIIRAVVDTANSPQGGNAAPAIQANAQSNPETEIATLVLQIIKEKNER